MTIKNIVRAAVFSTIAVPAGIAESTGHDQFENSVQTFMHSINDPNIKAHGKSNLLYDGNDLVVVNTACGPTAVRLFLNPKGNDLVALFAAYTGVPDSATTVKYSGSQNTYAHALIQDATQVFSNGNDVGAEWYPSEGGPLPLTTDEAQLQLAPTSSCGSSGGSRTVNATPEVPGTPVTPPVTGGPCNCNGGPDYNPPSQEHGGTSPGSEGGGPGGGNTPPGFEGAAFDVVNKALSRTGIPALMMG